MAEFFFFDNLIMDSAGVTPVGDQQNKIFQFKIILKSAKPPIWRRVQVPWNFTFEQLHYVIQRSMGWEGYHLHMFRANNPYIFGNIDYIGTESSQLDYVDLDMGQLDERRVRISQYFRDPKDKCEYDYDFGDKWKHIVVLEKVIPENPRHKYPRCVTGRRACPPEDCGGVHSYQLVVSGLKDPDNPKYGDWHALLEELRNESFNPEHFDPKSVVFEL